MVPRPNPFVRRSLVVVAAAAATRLFFVWSSAFLAGDSPDYLGIAGNLLAGNGFAIYPTTPTMFRAPLYPIFVAASEAACGIGPACVLIAQVFLGAAGAWLLYVLGRRLLPEGVAFLGALLAAVYPHLAFYSATVLSETLIAFLLVLGTLAAHATLRAARPLRIAVVTGLVLGALALTSPRFALLPVAVAVLLALRGRDRRRLAMAVLGIAAGFALAVVPWALRNAVVFRAPVPFTLGSQAISFWLAADRVGLYDYRFEELAKGEPLLARWLHLYIDEPQHERGQVAERLQLESELNADAWAKIGADPVGFVAHRLAVLPYLWVQPAAFAGYFHPPLETQNKGLAEMVAARAWIDAAVRVAEILVFTVGLFGGAILGFWALRRRLPDVAVLYIPALYVTVLHSFVWIEHRYSVPAHPLLWLIAAAGLASLYTAAAVRLGRAASTQHAT